MGIPSERERAPDTIPSREISNTALDVIAERERIIPPIQYFLPKYSELLNINWTRRNKLIEASPNASSEPYQNAGRPLYDPILQAGRLLTHALRKDERPKEAAPETFLDDYEVADRTIEGENILSHVFSPHITNSVLNGIEVLGCAYRPQITDSLLIGRSVLRGRREGLNRLSSRMVTSVLSAAKGLLSDDEELYKAGLKQYSAENKASKPYIFRRIKRLAVESENSLYYKNLLDEYGTLAAAVVQINDILHDIYGEETYGIQVNNSILVGDSVLEDAVGGEISDSIIASNQPIENTFSSTRKLYVRNTYVVTPDKMLYIEEDLVGRDTSTIDWNGYPNLRQLSDLNKADWEENA